MALLSLLFSLAALPLKFSLLRVPQSRYSFLLGGRCTQRLASPPVISSLSNRSASSAISAIFNNRHPVMIYFTSHLRQSPSGNSFLPELSALFVRTIALYSFIFRLSRLPTNSLTFFQTGSPGLMSILRISLQPGGSRSVRWGVQPFNQRPRCAPIIFLTRFSAGMHPRERLLAARGIFFSSLAFSVSFLGGKFPSV